MVGHNKVYGVCENKCLVDISNNLISNEWTLMHENFWVGEEGYESFDAGDIPKFPKFKVFMLLEKEVGILFELKCSLIPDTMGKFRPQTLNDYNGLFLFDNNPIYEYPHLKIYNPSLNRMKIYDIYFRYE